MNELYCRAAFRRIPVLIFIVSLVVFFIFLNTRLPAQIYYENITPFAVTGTRELGCGGAHTAYPAGLNTILVNPAALYLKESTTGIFSIGAGLCDELSPDKNIIRNVIYGDNIDDSALKEFGGKQLFKAPPRLDLRGPLALGAFRRGRGIALFNKFSVDSTISYSGIKDTSDNIIYAAAKYRSNVNIDGIISGAVSFPAVDTDRHKLYLGLGIKALFRYVYTRLGPTDPPVEVPYFNYSVKDNIIDNTEQTICGAGIDLSLLYKYKILSLGFSVQDAGTACIRFHKYSSDKKRDDIFMFYPKVNLGVCCTMFSGPRFKWDIFADLNDMCYSVIFGDYSKNIFLNISAGTEMTFYNRFSIRAGMNHLLPSAGIGFNTGRFGINLAVYLEQYDYVNTDYIRPGADIGIDVNL